MVAGTRGGGGGSPEGMRRRRMMEMALEALYLSTIYVIMSMDEW
jgi:hypothetical protein